MSWLKVSLRRIPVISAVIASVLMGNLSQGSETDNFYLPPDMEFADLGDLLESVHTRAIENVVEDVNSRIERALKLKDEGTRTATLARHQSPERLTREIAAQFGSAPIEEARILAMLRGRWARDTFPEQTVRHRDISMHIRGRSPIDIRVLGMFAQSDTVKAYGVYFGLDKVVHFHQLGRQYYNRYLDELEKGLSPEDARREMIHYFSKEAVLAEDKGFGTIISGIYSNADMASNYAGFLFFLNITQSIQIDGRTLPPLVVRCGSFWRVNDHVHLHSGWFEPFVSDHWNEALNPSLYDKSMRDRVRRILEERADTIVGFYTGVDGRPNDPEYFAELAVELATYFGEPYGHSGQLEDLMHLGNTCIPALQQLAVNDEQPSSLESEID